MRRRYVTLVFALALIGVASATAILARLAMAPVDEEYDIALIGDIPYNADQEEQTARLFEELNREELAFVVHDGDIKSGSSVCTEDVYEKELGRFEDSRNPLVYTPGDNEWTDCHRPPNPNPEESDPLNRLGLVREKFFSSGGSLGRNTLSLERQSGEYPENARWSRGGVTFATLHLVGSNNNLPTAAHPTTGNETEYGARNAANIAWLRETFDEAGRDRSPAVMLVIHANPFGEDNGQQSGFAGFKAALEEETVAFGKPVVLVHGDSHTFRIDKPVISERRPPNFTRVETFGSPDVHWVRATVDPRDGEVFSFEPEMIEENEAP